MTTVLYQGSQTSLDSRFLESKMLKLKVHPFDVAPETLNLFDISWGPIQSLYNTTSSCLKPTEPTPTVTNFEMCTETLGDENGSDFSDSNTLFLFPSPVEETPGRKKLALSSSGHAESNKVRRHSEKRRACDFPPPLTSLSGPDRVRLSSRRESGKLVMEAVRSSAPAINVERAEGRVVMSMMVEPRVTDATTRDAEEDSPPDSNNVSIAAGREEFPEMEINLMSKEEDDDVDIFVSTDIGLEGYRRPTRCKDGDRKKPIILHRFWVTT